jgi:hypothetical protein
MHRSSIVAFVKDGEGMESRDSALDIQLFVYRRLDNRSEGQSDQSPQAFELHLMRKEALHDALGGVDGLEVDWREADDTKSHELALLFVSAALNPHVHTVAIAGLTWAGAELAKAGIGEVAKQAVNAVISRLILKQKEGKILNFYLRLPGGLLLHVSRESELSVSHNTTWPTVEDHS